MKINVDYFKLLQISFANFKNKITVYKKFPILQTSAKTGLI